MDGVADGGGPFDGDIFGYGEAISYIAGTRVLVGDDAIWVFPPEGPDVRFEVVDVLFGPFDLETNSGHGVSLVGHGKEASKETEA